MCSRWSDWALWIAQFMFQLNLYELVSLPSSASYSSSFPEIEFWRKVINIHLSFLIGKGRERKNTKELLLNSDEMYSFRAKYLSMRSNRIVFSSTVNRETRNRENLMCPLPFTVKYSMQNCLSLNYFMILLLYAVFICKHSM